MKATYSKRHLLVLCAVLLTGCATRPTTPPTHTWRKPDDKAITGVRNFGKVSPELWRGEQPTAEGFLNLQREGAKTIVSLRSDHDDLPLLRGTKLKYIRIPMHAGDPDQGADAQLVLVMATLDRLRHDPKSWPVFIHCKAGRDRTGYAVATYRMAFQNWPANDAIEEMFDYRFNTAWIGNPPFLQRLDIRDVRKRVKRAP